MKKSTVIFASFLIFALTCESAHQKLRSINALKDIDFGQSVPKHSLLLLHWFANAIIIDNNNILYLCFDPDQGEFGAHHYGNFEGMLDPLPRGHRYYTVGNLYGARSRELPDYVLRPPVREYLGSNLDRIIFNIQDENSGVHRIDQVYLTQHYLQHENQGSRYNPEHTYGISPNLLQQMRMFSVQDNHRSLQGLRDMFHSDANLRDIRNIWGASLASLGLLLFIVIQEKHCKKKPIANRQPSTVRANTRQPSTVSRNTVNPIPFRTNTQPDFVVNMPDECYAGLLYSDHLEGANLEIETGKNGKATIVWGNVSRHRINDGVAVVLFKNQWDYEASSTYKLIQSSDGRYDTSVPLNEGLQVRLHRARRYCCFWTKVEEEICRGPEFKSPGMVQITGTNAYLKLFVRDGKACARLYVRKSFRQWKSEFEQSWVGFYTSAERGANEHGFWKWQWATKFEPGPDAGDFNTLEYCSAMKVAPGVQARFILKNYKEIARTPIWQ